MTRQPKTSRVPAMFAFSSSGRLLSAIRTAALLSLSPLPALGEVVDFAATASLSAAARRERNNDSPVCPDPSMEYFDPAGLVCSECDPSLGLVPDRSRFDPAGNALRCACRPGLLSSFSNLAYYDPPSNAGKDGGSVVAGGSVVGGGSSAFASCSTDELRRGSCEDAAYGRGCLPTCVSLGLTSSRDGTVCVSCGLGFAGVGSESSSWGDADNRTAYLNYTGWAPSHYNNDGGGNAVVGVAASLGLGSSEPTCSCGNPLRVSVPDRTPVSTLRLVEVYDGRGTGRPIRQDCLSCPTGTAVISEEIVYSGDDNTAVIIGGDVFHETAGRRYVADSFTCVSCPDDNMYFDGRYQCVCLDGYDIRGEASVGETYCVHEDDMPTVVASTSASSGDYRVTFSSANGGSGKTAKTITTDAVDSVVLSHYYPGAASACEYTEAGSTPRGAATGRDPGEACQSLANLCVLAMYDEDSAPCRQLEYIRSLERRVTTPPPWLYYVDVADDVTEDRGVRMRMAFKGGVPGRAHRMTYKLVKYRLNGEYVGVEDLRHQLRYCRNDVFGDIVKVGLFDGSEPRGSPEFLTFGNNRRHIDQCDLTSLMDREMFFYDMFLVDSGDAGGACASGAAGYLRRGTETDCLYPVPILHRNFAGGGRAFGVGLSTSFPNMNSFPEDEGDDRYTRRLFLFDNMSGKSASGNLEVLRYARRIVLETTIQEEDPTRIYPPRLVVEYEHVRVDGAGDDSDAALWDDVIFRVEYAARTERFWTNVEVMMGFVCAVGVVVWILRCYNWQNRNRLTGTEAGTGGGGGAGASARHGREEYMLVFSFVVHVVMLAFHTFVWVFFPLMFGICAYWFVLFKVQDEVFLLLPPDSEFYDVGNEYYFFFTLFQGMFWLHTVYIAYVIFCQCNVDIFLIDWERRKGRYDGGVSLWRTVLVANEWNRMQARRKTSIEFNIIIVGFLLIGLKLNSNAQFHPSFGESPYGYDNIALRFANTVFLWTLTELGQWLWRFLFYERYCTEPLSQRFIDLCTVAKISVFLLDEPQHGYYLHCRSPYEHADCSMQELIHQLEREASGLTTDRGLDAPGCPPDAQSFEIFVSSVFRRQIDKVLSSLTSQQARPNLRRETGRYSRRGPAAASPLSSSSERVLFARSELNAFLQSFFDQSPPPQREGLCRIVREAPLAERLLGVPPADVRARDGRCVLHLDRPPWIHDLAFLQVTFLGRSIDLFLHDVLAFNAAELIFESPAVSLFLVYVLHLMRTTIRSRLGRSNIVRKTFVDDRFLF